MQHQCTIKLFMLQKFDHKNYYCRKNDNYNKNKLILIYIVDMYNFLAGFKYLCNESLKYFILYKYYHGKFYF